MSEKDYILARLDILKILVSALFGAILIAALYYVQNPASSPLNFIYTLIAIVMFGIFLILIGGTYRNLLNKLKKIE